MVSDRLLYTGVKINDAAFSHKQNIVIAHLYMKNKVTVTYFLYATHLCPKMYPSPKFQVSVIILIRNTELLQL